MKKLLVFTAAVLSLLSFSCEEDFNPKADFEEKYVLWCVVNSEAKYDPAVQNVVLSKLYNVDGFDPYSNKTDPALSGAAISIFVDQTEYKLIEDTSRRKDTTRYPAQFIYYRTSPVKLRLGSALSIKAKLPNGQVLTSETRLPVNQGLTYSNAFYRGFSTVKRDTLDKWTVYWHTEPNHVFFPKLLINYRKQIGDSLIKTGSQPVPIKYVDNKPYYIDYTVDRSVTYDFSAIDSAMAMISKGDTLKESYWITKVSFELIEYDGPLSQYYSSINGYLDNYSIRLDETVYSNINGGMGIFGSLYYINRQFILSPGYASWFGYHSLK